MRQTKTLDMTQGSVLKKLWTFVVPAILSNLVQQTYTIADRVVAGRFAADGTTVLPAVGSTGQITALFVYLLLGFPWVQILPAPTSGEQRMKKVYSSVCTQQCPLV